MTTQLAGIKVRLYPNVTQQHQLWQMFGNSRFVWNQMLAMANERYQNNPESKYVSRFNMHCLLTQLKCEYPFLRNSDSTALQTAVSQLDLAFQSLFQHRGGHPKFRSRNKSIQSYTGHSTVKIYAKRYLRLPKLGTVKTSKLNQLKDVKIKQYTILHTPADKYYIAFQVEREVQPKVKTGKVVGIDLNARELAVVSNGDVYLRREHKWLEQQRRQWQRRYNRRKNQATESVARWNHEHRDVKEVLTDYINWQKAKQQRARYSERIVNQRHDNLQKLTTDLVTKYDVIIMEDLRTKNLLKNHKVARTISDASWAMLKRMLQYKCDWYGKRLILVNPAHTTQQCHDCGFIMGTKGTKKLELSDRQWTCPQCHKHHNRDVNAALNIYEKGLQELNANG